MNELRGFAQEMAEAYRQNYPALPGPGVPNTPARSASRTPYELLQVLNTAPIEVCEAAYRALSKLYHPDVTGSAATQRRLNQAIEQIRKERQT